MINSIVHLKSKGICHSDIKAENIALNNLGIAVLLDLGAAISYGTPIKVKKMILLMLIV